MDNSTFVLLAGISGVVGLLIGMTKKRAVLGLVLGLLLGPIGWILVGLRAGWGSGLLAVVALWGMLAWGTYARDKAEPEMEVEAVADVPADQLVDYMPAPPPASVDPRILAIACGVVVNVDENGILLDCIGEPERPHIQAIGLGPVSGAGENRAAAGYAAMLGKQAVEEAYGKVCEVSDRKVVESTKSGLPYISAGRVLLAHFPQGYINAGEMLQVVVCPTEQEARSTHGNNIRVYAASYELKPGSWMWDR